MSVRKYALLVSMFLVISGLAYVVPPTDAMGVDNMNGPYIDTLVYFEIAYHDQQVLALQDDEIDLIGDMVNPTFLETLLEAADIEVANVQRNGYGYLSINTQKYPQNVTDFRRALAFALDKEAISDDVWDGLSLPGDSPVPMINPWSIEGQLPYTYYESNVALGNYLLDRAGFHDIDADDIREAPDGSEFDVLVECAQSSNVAIEVGDFIEDALLALHIDGRYVPTDFYEYLDRLYFHGDYDMVYLEEDFSNLDINWLAYEFWSEKDDEPYQNFANFANATFDSWRDQLLHATEYADVYEAAIEMQEILVYECPIIVCFQNTLLSGYRTDRFENHVNDVSEGVPGWWTNYKVRMKTSNGGPYGGTFRIGATSLVDTFNFMTSPDTYSSKINNMMWDSLMRKDSDGTDLLWLAESYIAETHADNAAVPEGYTQFLFNMVQNATWSDGLPITAEDAAFSLNYFRDSPGNPYGPDLSEMTAAYAPTTYQLVVQFSSESYWHLNTVAYKPIIPKHVFTLIGLEGWDLWNPNPPVTPMVTSGPFNVSDYEPGEYIELSRNPEYFYSSGFLDPFPTISAPTTVQYTVGSSGNSILWEAEDNNPYRFYLYRDTQLIDSGDWVGGNIFTSIDGLSVGVYEYVLYVYDESNQIASASVTVTVTEVGVVVTDGPTIDSPDDISYFEGDTGNSITWTAEDDNPLLYRIQRNGSNVDDGAWTTSPGEFTINVDGLDEGVYSFVIYVGDSDRNFEADEVIVTVVSNNPFPGFENSGVLLSIGVTAGSAVVIIYVIFLITRAKREGPMGRSSWIRI